MKKFKVIARETITHEIIVEAKDFDDACGNWYEIATDDDYKIKHTEWNTDKVKEIKNTQRQKEKAELIQELGYDPDRDPMQDYWDHESDKIAIQQEFHDNETS